MCRIAIDVGFAQRKINPFIKPRGVSAAARRGLAYERTVHKALKALKNDFDIEVEHQPCFEFADAYGTGTCIPDFLLHYKNIVIVVEVKLTFIVEALHKLQNLYLPVVGRASNLVPVPLVIVKNMTKDAPKAMFKIGDAIERPYPLLHWLGNGPLFW